MDAQYRYQRRALRGSGQLSGTLENLEALLTKGNVILHVRGQLFAASDVEDSRLLRGDPCGRWLPRTAPAVN